MLFSLLLKKQENHVILKWNSQTQYLRNISINSQTDIHMKIF